MASKPAASPEKRLQRAENRDARPEKRDDTTNERANRSIAVLPGRKTPKSTRETRETVRKPPYRRVRASNRPFREFFGPRTAFFDPQAGFYDPRRGRDGAAIPLASFGGRLTR
jgi:hypothetical protein